MFDHRKNRNKTNKISTKHESNRLSWLITSGWYLYVHKNKSCSVRNFSFKNISERGRFYVQSTKKIYIIQLARFQTLFGFLLLILFVFVFRFGQPGEPLVDLEQGLTLARVHVGDVLLVAQEGILLDDAQLVELAEPT